MPITWEAVVVAITPQAASSPTLTPLGQLPWSTLTTRDELAGEGLATVVSQIDRIDPAIRTRLLDLSQTPAELWIYRNGGSQTGPVFAGPITGCSITDRTVTITAPGLLAYLRYWLRDSDYTGDGLDIATIVKNLVDQWQAQSYGNDGIDTSGVIATGATVLSFSVAGRDGKYLNTILTELGQRDAGFDMAVDPSSRKLMLWAPRKGSNLTTSTVLDWRSIAKVSLQWTIGPGVTGSEVFGTASSSSGPSLQSIRSNTTLRATFGRSYVTKAFTNIADQSALDAAATRAATDLSTQHFSFSHELLPVQGFGYGDFATGDIIRYSYDAGLGLQEFDMRIASIETTVNGQNERLKVGML